MTAATQPARADYSAWQKVIHWLMGLLIMLDLFVAQKFGGVMEDWDRLESRSDHATVGTIVTVLFVIRLLLRWRYGAPAMPAGMPDWQVKMAHAAHWALYFLIGLLIVSGVATAMNAADPVTPFGAFDLTIGRSDETVFQTLRPIHEFATIGIIALIGLHVVAALYHQFVARDRLLVKMLKFWKSEQPETAADTTA